MNMPAVEGGRETDRQREMDLVTSQQWRPCKRRTRMNTPQAFNCIRQLDSQVLLKR